MSPVDGDLGALEADRLRDDTDLPPPLSERVRRTVCDDCGPVRPIWPRWLRFLVAAAAGAITTAVVGLLTRSAWHDATPQGLPQWLYLGTLAIWAVGALVLTWMAVCESDPRAPVRSRSRVAMIVGLAVAFAGMAVATDYLADGSVGAAGDGVVWGMRCLTMGSVVLLAPVLVVFLLIARGAPFHPIRAGTLAGVAAGGWALVLLQIRCPSTGALHNIFFHLGVAALWGAIGSGVGLWLARRRARAC